MALFALRLPAQTSLEFFTNQANALLLPAFGFGVANIPVYSSANPALAYSASLHYLLQSAANAYDATTPATDSPSVFRPLFDWSSNTLFIVGYTNVTTDFYAQTGQGFKALTDPTIASNDNVWGIPWVVGAKNNPPAFNEYCYSTAVIAERQLLFVRSMDGNGQPETNMPPMHTNQFFMMTISNLFGVEAWNFVRYFVRSNFPDGVTIVASNQVSITITNNSNWGTNFVFSAATNWNVNSWPGWTGGSSDGSFLVPIFTNVIPLPPSYWSESTGQFVPLPSNGFLSSDLTQHGWPEYDWTLNITNNVIYGLIDSSSGLVLDFVNLAGFGSSLPIAQLTNQQGFLETNNGLAWATNGATDAPNSPMSSGVLYQIEVGEITNPFFANDLIGVQPGTQDAIFGDPYVPINEIVQNCTWQTVNPLVHYTVEDLTEPDNEEIVFVPTDSPLSLGSQISNTVCSLGRRNLDYNPGTVENLSFGLTAGTFQLNFSGVNDLPYTIWASTNMLDWSQIGIASQPDPGSFQFNDLAATNYPARFYQLRLPQ